VRWPAGGGGGGAAAGVVRLHYRPDSLPGHGRSLRGPQSLHLLCQAGTGSAGATAGASASGAARQEYYRVIPAAILAGQPHNANPRSGCPPATPYPFAAAAAAAAIANAPAPAEGTGTGNGERVAGASDLAGRLRRGGAGGNHLFHAKSPKVHLL